MRRLITIILFSSLMFLPKSYSNHSLSEGIKMIDNEGVYLDKITMLIDRTIPIKFENKSLFYNDAIFSLSTKKPHTISRLFSSLENEFAERLVNPEKFKSSINLANYVQINFANSLSSKEAKSVLKELYSKKEVKFAYFEAIQENAVYLKNPAKNTPIDYRNFSFSPDYQGKQYQLEPSPRGVNGFYGWTVPGGDGEGVHIVDVEWGWQENHEDFKAPFWELKKGGKPHDHGTAVWGIVAAKKDGSGMTGIAPESNFGTGWFSSANSYIEIANRLKKEKVGIIIIEQHRKGPDNNKFCPNEYWQATFDAFKKITTEYGIHIVAAAGNGNSNLNSSAYNGAFDRTKRDSGAVLVGAAGPPTGNKHLQRLGFSNYGSRIDAFGYGSGVYTTGYGDLYGKGDKKRQYTARFSGTSSATPVVAGAVASILGIANNSDKKIPILEMRKALLSTGAKQKGGDRERIGSLPDIKALKSHLEMKGFL